MSENQTAPAPHAWAMGVALASLRLEAAKQRGAAQHAGPWAGAHRKRAKALEKVIAWMEAANG